MIWQCTEIHGFQSYVVPVIDSLTGLLHSMMEVKKKSFQLA